MSERNHFEAYFDFDNTLTDFDVLDDIIQSFSLNDDWKTIEDQWDAGLIGSKECLERQLSQVRLTATMLADYIKNIQIDGSFRSILDLLESRNVPTVIVSDSFGLIIRQILENNGITGLPILANEMRLEGDIPVISFPYFQSICSTCANCKTSHLFRRNRPLGTKKIYVGDGRSDICASSFCEILFAKGTLYRHYAPLRPDCIEFTDLSSVYVDLQRLLV